MPEAESALYVPLRSNAKSLVTGAPIAALRRQLKYASVFHDTLILESGILRMHAGAGGSFSSVDPPAEDDPPNGRRPAGGTRRSRRRSRSALAGRRHRVCRLP